MKSQLKYPYSSILGPSSYSSSISTGSNVNNRLTSLSPSRTGSQSSYGYVVSSSSSSSSSSSTSSRYNEREEDTASSSPYSSSRRGKKHRNQVYCGNLSGRECGELGCIFILLFMAIVALIFLLMGSATSLCELRPVIDTDNPSSPYYVPPLPPCQANPLAEDIFRLRPDLRQYTSVTYADYQRTIARTQHPHEWKILDQIQQDARYAMNRWRISTDNPKALHNPMNKLPGRPWFDIYRNTSNIPCRSLSYIGNRLIGERKYMCGSKEWKNYDLARYQASTLYEENGIPSIFASSHPNKIKGNTNTEFVGYTVSPPCPILSIGSNLEWEFENDILSNVIPSSSSSSSSSNTIPLADTCTVYVADCTVNPKNFHHPDARIRPLSVCVDEKRNRKPSVIAKGLLKNGERIPSWIEYYDSIDRIIYNAIGLGNFRYLYEDKDDQVTNPEDRFVIEDELSVTMDIHEDTVQKYERNEIEPTVDKLLAPDLWKVDCEGCEFSIALSLLQAAQQRSQRSHDPTVNNYATSSVMKLPSQIAMEVHTKYLRQCAEYDASWLFYALARAGYVITHREDNPTNEFVSEFSFARLYCEA